MTPPAEQLTSALTATWESHATEASPSIPPEREGWHPGARLGADAEHGILLAYNDSGADGICVLLDGDGVWLNEERGGFSRDFTHQPYSVWKWQPSYNGQPAWLAGALAPQVAKVELATEDGAVVLADVVDSTFAVQMTEELRCVRETLDETDDDGDWFERLRGQARAEMSKATIRAYGYDDVLLYEGPSIAPAGQTG